MIQKIIFISILLISMPAAVAVHAADLKVVPHKVAVTNVNYKERSALRVVEAGSSTDEDKIAIISNSQFTNGTISGYISGGLNKAAGAQARGFVGIAFRIADDVSSFEAIYLRPTNARAENQLRRNHSMQYISHPDYPWYRLRKETPGKYESYADMQPGEWIHYRLEVAGEKARLYLNHAEQPVLLINDLKLGERAGAVGLWIGPGTEAHFADIQVQPQ